MNNRLISMDGEQQVKTAETAASNMEQIQNEKLRAAIARVLQRGGADHLEARYDRQHHRHNKS